ncbi:MAG TPA: flagellar hook-length control protein FliK [Nocardioides sp.]|nr:flagellar hook-length control protein FliK [Nocardioides sp.]
MSIAPFLPGLPQPASPDGGLGVGSGPGGAGAGSGGGGTAAGAAGREGEPAFGDALLAALAGGQGVVPPPTVELGFAPVDLGFAAVDSAVAAVDLGFAAVESAVAAVDLGFAAGTAPSEVAPPGRRTTNDAAAARTPLPAPTAAAGDASAISTTAHPGSAHLEAAFVTPREPGPATSRTDGPDALSPATGSMTASADSTAANPNSTAANPKSTVERAVVQQVFPEVTRMSQVASTGGNGTHRITLTLQPELLGEVRVTLVVRDGSVQVRLAGGAGASADESAALHRALASGAPELQRLLERTGAEARVSVRDPFGGALSTTTAATAATATATATSTSTPAPATTTGGQPGLQAGPDSGAGAQSGPDARYRQDGQSPQEHTREHPREQGRQHEQRRASYDVTPLAPRPTVAGRLDRTV